MASIISFSETIPLLIKTSPNFFPKSFGFSKHFEAEM